MWKFVLFAVAAFILWKMFKGDLNRRKQEAQTEQETLIAKGEMVKDPVCGSYVALDNSVRLQAGGEIMHFCSYECRDKYLKQIGDSKPS